MKSRFLLIAGMAFLFAVASFLFRYCGNSSPEEGKIALSYDACLGADSGYQVVQEDTLYRRNYLQQYWVDNNQQFYSKTLASLAGDTLFVSVFNNASLKTTRELLLKAGMEELRREQASIDGMPVVKILARSPEGKFFLRYLIDARKFRAVTMVDLPGADSSLLLQKFETENFTQKIEKCI
ncbi:MAG: hypothetical protein H6560_26040 [Lewinellaceae bacterium]|nr:hypothetical protein [Lewinellaceae bacterium]